MKIIIALTGGIGSGKSIVSAMLRTMGYPVYDCDSKAKLVMDNSEDIKRELMHVFGRDAISVGGVINRQYLGNIVFNDATKLEQLNSIVHPAVRCDLQQWIGYNNVDRLFVETAILRSSGLGDIVDREWNVQAPLELRVNRVMKRNGMSREAVLARIQAQAHEMQTGQDTTVIINDGTLAVLPQILDALSKI